MTFVLFMYKHNTASEDSHCIRFFPKEALPFISRPSLFDQKKSQQPKKQIFLHQLYCNSKSISFIENAFKQAFKRKWLQLFCFDSVFNKQKQHFCRLCSDSFSVSPGTKIHVEAAIKLHAKNGQRSYSLILFYNQPRRGGAARINQPLCLNGKIFAPSLASINWFR